MKPTGVALVTVLAMLLVVSAVVFGMTYTTQITQWIMRNDNTSTQANYIALAGLQKYKTSLLQNYRTVYTGSSTGTSSSGCISAPNAALDLDRGNSGAQSSMTENINGGSVTVTITRDAASPNLVILKSVGNYGGAKSSVRAILSLSGGGLFSNAFVGGSGSSQMINGNATIYGGVFLEGNPSDTSNSNTVFTLGGSVSLQDSYAMSNSNSYPLYNYITPTSVANMCSSVRIAHGRLNLQGSADIGTSSNPLTGIYVGDPSGGGTEAKVYQGNSNSPISPQDCSNGLCASGIGRYDLSSTTSPRFYYLDTPANLSNACDGTTVNSGGQSWRACINGDSLGDSKTLILQQNGNAFALPAKKLFATNTQLTKPSTSTCSLTSSTITLNSSDIDCVYKNGSTSVLGFKYSKNSKVLEVYGNVAFQGFDLSVGTDIKYRASGYNSSALGAASLIFERRCSSGGSYGYPCGGNSTNGTATLSGDLLPDKDWPSTNSGKFPLQTLTIIADGNSASTDSLTVNNDAAAVLYSAKRLHLTGNNNIAGVLLGDNLCVGNNCSGGGSSNIYFVDPTTTTALPTALALVPRYIAPTVQSIASERY